ncbi:hypothetical protein Tco_0020891 [Tanacetum coccineum]
MKSKHSRDDYPYCADHTTKLVHEQWVDTVDHDRKWTEVEEEKDSNEVQAVSFYPRTEPVKPLEWKTPKNRLTPSSIKDKGFETRRKTKGTRSSRFGVESSSSEDSDNSSGNTNSIESLYPNFQKVKGFHAVPPPTGTVIPPRANVSFTGIDELAIRNKVINQEKTKSSQPEIDRNKVIIEDWVDSDDEETDVTESQYLRPIYKTKHVSTP